MELLENTLDRPIDDVLARPVFCHLATRTADGIPRVSPLWYLWEDNRLWILADRQKTYVDRVKEHPATAVSIVDFDPFEGTVWHIGMRGTAAVVPFDAQLADRKLARYLGPDKSAWDPRFHELDPTRWRFIEYEPETVVARDQSYQPSRQIGEASPRNSD